jgi:F0F1-type ATP synthase assembly protein I
MTETKTPSTTPSPNPGPNSQQVTVGKPENPTSVFTGMALDMSWKLAIVVLVPIIGGYEIDSRTGTTPLITILGFVLAMVGVGYVMWQTLQSANKATAPKPEKRT